MRYLDYSIKQRLAWFDNLPQEMRQKFFLLWWLTWNENKEKYDKKPSYVDGGSRVGTQGSPLDLNSLTDFNRARERLRALWLKGEPVCPGITLLPHCGLSCIDVDSGDIEKHEKLLLNGFSERSVSGGNRAHVFVRGDIGIHKQGFRPGIDVYNVNQGIAVTGRPIWPMLGNGELVSKKHAVRILKINGTEYHPATTSGPSSLKVSFYNDVEEPKIVAALRAYRADKTNNEEWINVGMMLHSARTGDDKSDEILFNHWNRWSARDKRGYESGDMYPGMEALRERWSGWTRKGLGDHPLTLATLYSLAKKVKPSRPKRERLQFDNPGEFISDIEKIHYGKPRIFIDGLIAEGLTLLTGQKKLARKTFFVLQCAATSSLGDPFLGLTPTQPLRCVAYMLEEGGVVRDEDGNDAVPADVVVERLKSMSLLDDADKGRVRLKWELLPLQDGGIEQIEADAEMSDVIFIDSRQMIFNEDAEKVRNVWSKDYQQLLPLREIARKHHCAIVIVNHASKGSDARDAIDAGASTGGLDAAVDGILVMQNPNKDDPTRIRMTIHHRRMKNTELELRWDVQTCRFEKVGIWLGTGRINEILALVVRSTERQLAPSTLEIARGVFGTQAEKQRMNVSRMLTQLRRDGMVEIRDDGDDARIKLWRATPQALARYTD